MPNADPSILLVVGSGGREHALAWALARSDSVARIYLAPGNAGTTHEAKCRNVDLKDTDIERLVSFAIEIGAGMTVVGPEAPLSAGIVDRFRAAGLAVFGPTQAAARLESSKSWAREFMVRHDIPHPSFTATGDVETAKRAVAALSGQCVVKADGLAAGKGVSVCHGLGEGYAAVEAMMVERAFGASGDRVVVEECVEGHELSVMAVTDGHDYILIPPAQDHKALLDGDRGPNTGGMGAYIPTPFVTPELLAEVRQRIIEPAIAGMAAEDAPFTGCLFCGLMLTERGSVVLEFNGRFGDPETQVQLALLESDLAELVQQAVAGRLKDAQVRWATDRAAACVVLASAGYPSTSEAGRVIEGLDEAAQRPGVKILHAGTSIRNNEIVTTGGRALNVVCVQDTLAEAVRGAYAAIGPNGVHFEGMQYRTDIAAQALAQPNGFPPAGAGL